MSENDKCQFVEGDRVDHQKFGLGTVSDTPERMNGMSLDRTIRMSWTVPVTWDNPSITAKRVVSTFLSKLSSPDARPFSYYDKQWQPLLATWRAARRNYEEAVSSFRPIPDSEQLKHLKHIENDAWLAMQAFLQDEANGKHP